MMEFYKEIPYKYNNKIYDLREILKPEQGDQFKILALCSKTLEPKYVYRNKYQLHRDYLKRNKEIKEDEFNKLSETLDNMGMIEYKGRFLFPIVAEIENIYYINEFIDLKEKGEI